MIKIKNKFNIFYWKSLISNNNNFEDINITISNTYYILKVMEGILEDLIDDKNKFKNKNIKKFIMKLKK